LRFLLKGCAVIGSIVCENGHQDPVAGTACPVLAEIDCPFQWLNQSIVGTVIAKAKVETRSIEAASDSTAL
jgi:hypothetical protein